MLNWKTQKRLLDAGGLGSVVYILPARGGVKMETERRYIEKLLAEGRTVVYGRPDNRKRQWALPDRDILTPERWDRAERWLNEFMKGTRYEKKV